MKVFQYAKHLYSYSYDIPETGVIFCVYNAHPDREEAWKPNAAEASGVLSWRYHMEKKTLPAYPFQKAVENVKYKQSICHPHHILALT